MSGNRTYQFNRSATQVGVTASAQAALTPVAGQTTPITYLFSSAIGVHLLWTNNGATPSITQAAGMYIPANCLLEVSLGPNDQIEIISAAGTPTGNAWFTHVSG